jgi:hypothetical protein
LTDSEDPFKIASWSAVDPAKPAKCQFILLVRGNLFNIQGLSFTSVAKYSMKKGSGVPSSHCQSGEHGAGHCSKSGESMLLGLNPYLRMMSSRSRCRPSPIHLAQRARKLLLTCSVNRS